ncbi:MULTISPECIES: endonuclease III [unclassified Fusibacter]|uniref:endonuclease III n=1 Tax=unclassified Fusibacter TaxID=2624464 RepID=UPI001012B943|nr:MULTISPECIES: endonuclease III [unclassified Fusibacter]MCK8059629.1 endonuclease III [Fusibacter sp. A2]NPE21430.1 endonuclease III [Fusibacter sp. A1]RXV61842.1 endonuclease III [Fusibacter sp. A1]
MKRRLLTKEEREQALEILLRTYPHAKAELDHENAFELLIATMLSAQCTDIRVNIVTKELFKVLKKPCDISGIGQKELEDIIRTCGLYQTKAKNIRKTCELLERDFDGQVPGDIQTMTTLPGVGIKTANVVGSNAFGIPAIAVDTHVQRVSNRLGLVSTKDVISTERDLMKRIPKVLWTKMHHVLIFHGRYHCKARTPMCETCPVNHLCISYRKQIGE